MVLLNISRLSDILFPIYSVFNSRGEKAVCLTAECSATFITTSLTLFSCLLVNRLVFRAFPLKTAARTKRINSQTGELNNELEVTIKLHKGELQICVIILCRFITCISCTLVQLESCGRLTTETASLLILRVVPS